MDALGILCAQLTRDLFAIAKFLFAIAVRITGKLLKIDGYMLRGVWQALNCLFIYTTFCVIATGASPGQTKNEGRGT